MVVISTSAIYTNVFVSEYDKDNGVFVLGGEAIKKDDTGMAAFNFRARLLVLDLQGIIMRILIRNI
ncbi:hypothetical protein [Caldicellulosiruptor naganoensis]|uniref:hypothetical protein n=1 Tax=Caldicellulosiruptor naganoensis TaxID=29324 RepID=UPI0005EB9272|nr:hypothetical protein [Caldicellulosiruptor naganoensis]